MLTTSVFNDCKHDITLAAEIAAFKILYMRPDKAQIRGTAEYSVRIGQIEGECSLGPEFHSGILEMATIARRCDRDLF